MMKRMVVDNLVNTVLQYRPSTADHQLQCHFPSEKMKLIAIKNWYSNSGCQDLLLLFEK